MDSNSIEIKTQTALTRILRYALPHKVAVVLALLGLAIVAATETAIPALLKPLLDRGFSGKLDDIALNGIDVRASTYKCGLI